MRKQQLIAGTVLVGMLTGMCWSADWWPIGRNGEKSKAPLQVDNSPLKPEVKAATSMAPMLKEVAPSVVRIHASKKIDPRMRGGYTHRYLQLPEMPEDQQEEGEGSGVIVSTDGYILTNNHVVEGADTLTVILGEGGKEQKATVVGTDPRTDLAIVKIDADKLPAIKIGDSDQVEVGDRVYAIGNPFGVGITVTSGIVSAVKRKGLRITEYENFIQTDASINPGNSGGALVDAQGRLIGINTAIFSQTGGAEGIGFAIPTNLARNVMEQLLRSGRVSRGYLGVMIQPVDDKLRAALGLEDRNAVLVSDLGPDSPAAQAGIKAGDAILAVGDHAITDVDDLRMTVARLMPGADVKVQIVRDSKEQTISVKLGELPDRQQAGMRRGGPPADPEGGGLLQGVTMAPVTPAARERTGLPEEIAGVLVTGVEPGSAAARTGLMPGDVIGEIGRQAVEDPASAAKLARESGKKRLLLRIWRDGAAHYLAIAP